jgi:hypothetical protein
LRTAHDKLDAIVTVPWLHDPIPEILARAEALAALVPLLEPASPAADHVLDLLRRDGRVLAEVDSFGLLHGPIRTRYLAIIAAVATA